MKQPSLAGRAFVALALMIGFYAFAIGIVLILLAIPVAEVYFLHRLDFRIAIFCVIGAIIIAISIIPRPDQFVPPGPRLDAAQHPELIVELIRTAKAVEQEMPTEVYLVPDVNAWVAQRGGVMGFGSRRVMGLGLSLMQILNVSELRAVLAHEFGHFYGGDTKLGPWVYKTRGAIVRTVQSLEGQSAILQALFVGYAKLFLRITHAISRQQEFSADALAARTVGAEPLKSGLRITHGAGPAFVPFWTQEITPVLNAGFLPPIAEGFSTFIKTPHIAKAISEVVEQEIKATRTDPYDTHPPLRDRLAAIEKLPAVATPLNDRPAMDLLHDVVGLEQRMLAVFAENQAQKKLQPIAWSNVSQSVYIPTYQNMLRDHSTVLAGITPAQLPEAVATWEPFIRYIEQHNRQSPPTDEVKNFATSIVGAAITCYLHKQGWTISTAPGMPILALLGEMKVEPFGIVPQLSSGELTAEAWREQCAAIGIADLDLAKVDEK